MNRLNDPCAVGRVVDTQASTKPTACRGGLLSKPVAIHLASREGRRAVSCLKLGRALTIF